jgi:hypothetical protein
MAQQQGELIDGNILERAPVTQQRASLTARLLKWLMLEVGAAASNPVDLGNCSGMMKAVNGYK